MLRRWNTPTPSLGVWVERECPRCHRSVELPVGQICAECRREIARRAARLGRRVALGTTAPMALYVWLRMPNLPIARVVGVIGVAAWYVLSYLVVKRIAEQYLQ